MDMEGSLTYRLTIGPGEDSPSPKDFTRIITLITFMHDVQTGALERTLHGPEEFSGAHRKLQDLLIDRQPGYWENHQVILAATSQGWPDILFTLEAYNLQTEPPINWREYYMNGSVQNAEPGQGFAPFDPRRLINPGNGG